MHEIRRAPQQFVTLTTATKSRVIRCSPRASTKSEPEEISTENAEGACGRFVVGAAAECGGEGESGDECRFEDCAGEGPCDEANVAEVNQRPKANLKLHHRGTLRLRSGQAPSTEAARRIMGKRAQPGTGVSRGRGFVQTDHQGPVKRGESG